MIALRKIRNRFVSTLFTNYLSDRRVKVIIYLRILFSRLVSNIAFYQGAQSPQVRKTPQLPIHFGDPLRLWPKPFGVNFVSEWLCNRRVITTKESFEIVHDENIRMKLKRLSIHNDNNFLFECSWRKTHLVRIPYRENGDSSSGFSLNRNDFVYCRVRRIECSFAIDIYIIVCILR